jgi:hypothetical protein
MAAFRYDEQSPNETPRALARGVSFGPAFFGKVKSVAVYDLGGELMGMR